MCFNEESCYRAVGRRVLSVNSPAWVHPALMFGKVRGPVNYRTLIFRWALATDIKTIMILDFIYFISLSV